MPKFEIDESRESRIATEVAVDGRTDEEQANNWYYYLESKLSFPFKAKWKSQGRKLTPTEGAEVEVLEMSSEEDCTEDIFVEVLYREGKTKDVFSVPLSDLEPIMADSATTEAIADWNYWVNKGYQF